MTEPRNSLWAAFTEREREMRRLNLPLSSLLKIFSDSYCTGQGLNGGRGVDGPGSDRGCAPVDGPGSDVEGSVFVVDGFVSDRGCGLVGDPGFGVDGPGSCGEYPHVDGPGSCGWYPHVDGPGSCGRYPHVDGPGLDGRYGLFDDPGSDGSASRRRFKSNSELSCAGDEPVDFGNSNAEFSYHAQEGIDTSDSDTELAE